MSSCTERVLNSDMQSWDREKTAVCGVQPFKGQPAVLLKSPEFSYEME